MIRRWDEVSGNLPVDAVSGRSVGVYGVTAETLIASEDTLMGDTGLGVKL